MRKFASVTLSLFLFAVGSSGQNNTINLSLDQTIELARERSIDAMVVRNTYLAGYWTYRSHKAELLPSLNFTAYLANFSRSQSTWTDSTGEINYITNKYMNNEGRISIDQSIAATGGTVSLYSSLNRLDQYSPNKRLRFSSQPISVSYSQPFFTYNRLKWDKKIEPEKYELKKREYLESMEDITIKAVRMFYNLAVAQMNYDIAVSNYANTKTMYGIATRRFQETGSVTRIDLLQLELRMVNDSLSINTQGNNHQARLMEFKSFLGYNDKARIGVEIPQEVPEISMDVDFVLHKALDNGSFKVSQNINRLESERSVAQAKANRGISVSLNAQFGLSNDATDADRIRFAYSNLINREVFGVNLRIPIMDWGMGRGRVKVAQALQKTAMNRLEQSMIDFRQNVYLTVTQFNSQRNQLMTSKRANDIAVLRYDLAMKNFAAGSISVTDLNTAQKEKDDANVRYISEMYNYWTYYYNVRQLALYDFITNTDISAEYDKLIE